MIEFISETFATTAAGDVNITLSLFVEFTFLRQIIAIFHRDFMTFRQRRHTHHKPSCLHPSHIHQPSIVTQFFNRNGLQRIMYLVHFTHLRRSDMIGNVHRHYRCPFQLIQRLRRKILRKNSSIHSLTTKLQSTPCARIRITTFTTLPTAISLSYYFPFAVFPYI